VPESTRIVEPNGRLVSIRAAPSCPRRDPTLRLEHLPASPGLTRWLVAPDQSWDSLANTEVLVRLTRWLRFVVPKDRSASPWDSLRSSEELLRSTRVAPLRCPEGPLCFALGLAPQLRRTTSLDPGRHCSADRSLRCCGTRWVSSLPTTEVLVCSTLGSAANPKAVDISLRSVVCEPRPASAAPQNMGEGRVGLLTPTENRSSWSGMS